MMGFVRIRIEGFFISSSSAAGSYSGAMITSVKKEPIANFGSQPIDEALSLSSDTAGVGSVDDLPF